MLQTSRPLPSATPSFLTADVAFEDGGNCVAVHPDPIEVVALADLNSAVPLLPRGWSVVHMGGLAAVCRDPGQAERMAFARLPAALRLRAGVVLLAQPVGLSTHEAVQDWMLSHRPQFDALIERAMGCQEVRLLLTTPPAFIADQQDPQVSQEQGRILAKTAQSLRDVARSTCITPARLRGHNAGAQKLALSLLIETEALADVEAAIDIARRLAKAHGLTLHATAPGPIESFLDPL